mmetsp:Transcript_95944/g.271434  ORF Transcript_95944/g.271434 Transcript_95944/m.271434 type:complete len:218 (-) Transcript_95944:498-1151(-)
MIKLSYLDFALVFRIHDVETDFDVSFFKSKLRHQRPEVAVAIETIDELLLCQKPIAIVVQGVQARLELFKLPFFFESFILLESHIPHLSGAFARLRSTIDDSCQDQIQRGEGHTGDHYNENREGPRLLLDDGDCCGPPRIATEERLGECHDGVPHGGKCTGASLARALKNAPLLESKIYGVEQLHRDQCPSQKDEAHHDQTPKNRYGSRCHTSEEKV